MATIITSINYFIISSVKYSKHSKKVLTKCQHTFFLLSRIFLFVRRTLFANK